MVFKLNFYAIEPLLHFSVIHRRLKGLEFERSSNHQTPKAGYTSSNTDSYLMQIKKKESLNVSFSLFIHAVTSYITGLKQQASATLHNQLSDDTEKDVSLLDLEIMDSENTFSFKGHAGQKVLSLS